MKKLEVSVFPFNTQNTTILDIEFKPPIEEIRRIVIEGALYTGDKTDIKIDSDVVSVYGTVNWLCERQNVKYLMIAPNFGGIRIGQVTIEFYGEDDEKLRSKIVGASAALPVELTDRL